MRGVCYPETPNGVYPLSLSGALQLFSSLSARIHIHIHIQLALGVTLLRPRLPESLHESPESTPF